MSEELWRFFAKEHYLECQGGRQGIKAQTDIPLNPARYKTTAPTGFDHSSSPSSSSSSSSCSSSSSSFFIFIIFIILERSNVFSLQRISGSSLRQLMRRWTGFESWCVCLAFCASLIVGCCAKFIPFARPYGVLIMCLPVCLWKLGGASARLQSKVHNIFNQSTPFTKSFWFRDITKVSVSSS